MIAPDIAAIPASLASQPRWLLWRNEVRKGKSGEPGKPTKVPKTARNTNASSTEAATWASFEVIAAALASQPERFNGVGVVLGDIGGGRHFCGIDLDSCLDADGNLADWAQPFVALLTITFGETSPSGSGLKFFFLAAADDAREVRAAFGFTPNTWGHKVTIGANGKEHGPAIEIYIGPGRFFTVTGRQWPGSADEVIALDREALLRLAALMPKKRDSSRSAEAFRRGAELRRQGMTFEEMCAALRNDPDPGIADWVREKGDARQLKRIWDKAADKKPPRVTNALALMTFLGNHPEWDGALRLNAFTETILVREPFPPDGTTSGQSRPLREPADILEAMLLLQGAGFPKAGKGLVFDVLMTAAHRHSYHPVRQFLDTLRWDGTERLGMLFQSYFNGEIPKEQPARDRMVAYLEHISRCFMVAAVARIQDPGCKVDYLPVLVSDEGYCKSEALRALCDDPAWFSDDLSPDLVERDTKDSLVGKWIIELAELPHARREVERVKAFFSRRTDRYRRAYDRLTNDWPRTCVFAGTSNDLELISVTGNRRFWPFEVAGPIDVSRIIADRDQLWAEAVALHRDGYRWWLPPNIEVIAREQQDKYGEADTWDTIIETWTAGRQDQDIPFTLAQVFAGCLGIADAKLIPKPEQNRAAACLKRLRFRRHRRRYLGERDYWWERRGDGNG